MCFRCATLPNKLRYKHDDHFLTFSSDKDAIGQYWCDVCEKEANPKSGIYMCNDCNIIVHIKCLLGEDDMYMMPGGKIKLDEINFDILPNNRLTRNRCYECDNWCEGEIVFKTERHIVCYDCLGRLR